MRGTVANIDGARVRKTKKLETKIVYSFHLVTKKSHFNLDSCRRLNPAFCSPPNGVKKTRSEQRRRGGIGPFNLGIIRS